jgi:hypothetical protein
MQVLIKSGYSGDKLKRLNRVHVLQQLLFMSDILTAKGSKIDIEVLSRQPNKEQRSTLHWLNKQPTTSDSLFTEKCIAYDLPQQKQGCNSREIHHTNSQDMVVGLE